MGSTSNPLAAGVHQLVNIGNSPLAARVHQSGANISDSLAADEQPGINDARDPHEGHQLESVSIPPDFDPISAALEDEYTFSAQSTITSYIEKHFRRTLDKASRTAMHKAHPIPKTEATKAPKVDRFMQDYLASRFPKSEDSDLARIQTAMLRASGPMTCLWAEMIDNGLLGDPEATINVHDVLNIIQRSLVLLGNANEMISQLRRSRLLQLVDKSLQKYAQEPRPDSGECLFGVDFTKHLKGQVETDTSLAQVVSMSHRFHPYKNGRQPAITGTKQQFFEGALPGSGDLGRATLIPHHITNQEANQLTEERERTTASQLHQRGFRPLTTTKGVVYAPGIRYITPSDTCTCPSWWQTGPICSQLAVPDKRPLGARNSKGLPFTTESMAPTHHSNKGTLRPASSRSTADRNNQPYRKRSCSTSSQEPSTPDKPPFCSAQKRRRVASQYRSQEVKSIHKPTALQDGRSIYAINGSTEGFLHGKNRPKGCLPHGSCSRKISLPSGLSRRTRGVSAIPDTPIRALHRSLRLFKANQTCNPIPSSNWYSHNYIFRRHVNNSSNRGITSTGSVNSPVAILCTGVHNKHPKVLNSTIQTGGFPRLHCRHQYNDGNLAISKDVRNSIRGITSTAVSHTQSENTITSVRETGSYQTSSLCSTSSLSCSAAHEDITNEIQVQDNSNLTRGTGRTDMVVHRVATEQLLPYCATGGINGDRIRCLHEGLGSSVPRCKGQWTLDSRGSQMSYQYTGIESCISGNAVLSEGESRNQCSSQIGQSSSNSICQPHGRSIVDPSMSTSNASVGMVSSSPDSDSCRILARDRERCSRLGIPSSSRQQQLAIVTRSVRHSESPARPILHRPIRIQDELSSSNILQLETRSRSTDYRCLLNIMGQHITISVSTILSDWEGPNEDPERISGLGLPYCASLACPTLVHPIVVNGGQSSHLTSQQLGSIAESGPEATSTLNRREAIPDRLAYLRRKYEMQGISKRVTELLIESWRTNTNTSYNSAWCKWHSWCTRRGCDPTSTSINNVLQFLADQFDSGLQYRSINSLRSAISMTHTNISGIPIGQHLLVSRLLRGIFNIRPPLPRYSQSWNVSMVINFLSNYKSADLSVFQLAKKAVTLLALVNADRCSDLAALD